MKFSPSMIAGTVKVSAQYTVVYSSGATVYVGTLQECMDFMASLNSDDRMWHKIF